MGQIRWYFISKVLHLMYHDSGKGHAGLVCHLWRPHLPYDTTSLLLGIAERERIFPQRSIEDFTPTFFYFCVRKMPIAFVEIGANPVLEATGVTQLWDCNHTFTSSPSLTPHIQGQEHVQKNPNQQARWLPSLLNRSATINWLSSKLFLGFLLSWARQTVGSET